MLRKLIRVALFIYWAILLTATHLPPRHVPNLHVSDKLEHFTAYGLLAALLVLSMRGTNRALILRTVAIIMVAGALDELTQPLFGRDCELYDWFADSCGAVIGATIAVGFRRMLGLAA